MAKYLPPQFSLAVRHVRVPCCLCGKFTTYDITVTFRLSLGEGSQPLGDLGPLQAQLQEIMLERVDPE